MATAAVLRTWDRGPTRFIMPDTEKPRRGARRLGHEEYLARDLVCQFGVYENGPGTSWGGRTTDHTVVRDFFRRAVERRTSSGSLAKLLANLLAASITRMRAEASGKGA